MWLEKMREILAVSGIVFLVLGGIVFWVSEEITVKVEFMPFSFALIMVFVAGAVLLGVAFIKYLGDFFS